MLPKRRGEGTRAHPAHTHGAGKQVNKAVVRLGICLVSRKQQNLRDYAPSSDSWGMAAHLVFATALYAGGAMAFTGEALQSSLGRLSFCNGEGNATCTPRSCSGGQLGPTEQACCLLCRAPTSPPTQTRFTKATGRHSVLGATTQPHSHCQSCLDLMAGAHTAHVDTLRTRTHARMMGTATNYNRARKQGGTKILRSYTQRLQGIKGSAQCLQNANWCTRGGARARTLKKTRFWTPPGGPKLMVCAYARILNIASLSNKWTVRMRAI